MSSQLFLQKGGSEVDHHAKLNCIEFKVRHLSQSHLFVQFICDNIIKKDDHKLAESYNQELLRFLYIKQMNRDKVKDDKDGVSPSFQIGELWKTLLLFPCLYGEVCQIISGKNDLIDHNPAKESYYVQLIRFENVLNCYKNLFPNGFKRKSLWQQYENETVENLSTKRIRGEKDNNDDMQISDQSNIRYSSNESARTSKEHSFCEVGSKESVQALLPENDINYNSISFDKEKEDDDLKLQPTNHPFNIETIKQLHSNNNVNNNIRNRF